MFNELTRLHECAELFTLLTHYAELARPDRSVWQDRRMELDGCEPRDLTRLHGELIAYGWLELNAGVPPTVRMNAAPGCYRVTPAGVRAVKQARAGELDG